MAATVSVYLQAANEAADHQLYGLATSSSSGTTLHASSQDNNSGDGSPFPTSAVNKTIRRYTSANWNASPRGAAASTGTITARTNDNQVTTSFSGWSSGDVWVVDFNNLDGGFGKGDTKKSFAEGGTQTTVTSNADGNLGSDRLPRYYRTPVADVFTRTGENDSDPGTTKWELKCDSVQRSYTNAAIPLPIPVQLLGDQYYNKMIDIGMRNETINLSGTLIDRGTPSATNPRLQTLFDLIRTQHSVTISGNNEEQGKDGTGPDNVRNYMALTIGAGYEPSDFTESTNASDRNTPVLDLNKNLIVRDRNFAIGGNTYGATRTAKTFRGMVTQFNATQVGGRPDIWTWQMTFYVVKNEHDWTQAT